MEQLAQFVQGDFDSIRKLIALGLKLDTFSEAASGRAGEGELNQLAAQAGSQMNAHAAFAGSDHYNGSSHNFNLNVPVLYKSQKTWASTEHRYQSLEGKDSIIHVKQETSLSKSDSLNIPFSGTKIKSYSQKDVYVANKEEANGAVSQPVLVYQQYEGFVRGGGDSAREMLDKANGVLKYAGMKGEGVNMSNTLPSAGIFPADSSKTYKAAVMSFNLVFSEKGVQDIIYAPVQLIVKSFMNVMRESVRSVVNLGKVMDLFTIDGKGKVGCDYKTAKKRLGVSDFDREYDRGPDPIEIVRSLVTSATTFVKELAGIKNEAGWKVQSGRLASAASSGFMNYEDFFKVIVQLADVKDMSSEVFIHTDKKVNGEADVTQSYHMLNTHDNSADGVVSDLASMRERFAEPADLTD